MKKKVILLVMLMVFLVGCGENNSDKVMSIDSNMIAEKMEASDLSDVADGNNEAETKGSDVCNSNTSVSDKDTSDKKEQTSSSNKNESSNSKPSGNKNETQKPSGSSGNSNGSNTNTSTGQNKPSGNTGTSKPNTDTNKPSNNNSSSGSSNTGTTKPQEPEKPVHTHNWTEVTQTITHEEKGHYETQVVKEAWVEEHYDWRTLCGKCKTDLTDMAEDDITYHVAIICRSRYSTEHIKVGETQHPAETKEVWVVDQPASTETVVVGYKCSCGATKEK